MAYRKKCSIEGCKTRARRGGRCTHHGDPFLKRPARIWCFWHTPVTALFLCGREGCKYPTASGQEGVCSRHGSDEEEATPGLEEEDAKLGVEDEVEFHGAEDVSPPHDDPDNEERAGSANGETAGMIVQLTTAGEDEAVGRAREDEGGEGGGERVRALPGMQG